jgi:hypothetical protein
MAAYTLGTASQATGCAKSTILRAIKAGRISAVRDDLGQWQIEPAQLFHVFPTLANPDATPQIGPMKRTRRPTPWSPNSVPSSPMRGGQDDVRQERDHWRAAHEREQAAHAATQRLLLPGPAMAAERDAPVTGENAPAPETPLKFWCW